MNAGWQPLAKASATVLRSAPKASGFDASSSILSWSRSTGVAGKAAADTGLRVADVALEVQLVEGIEEPAHGRVEDVPLSGHGRSFLYGREDQPRAGATAVPRTPRQIASRGRSAFGSKPGTENGTTAVPAKLLK